jgi:hypothetical protein
MRWCFSFLALAAVLGLAFAADAKKPADKKADIKKADEKPADAEKINRLLELLGSDEGDEREQAARELEKIGVAALPALREAATEGDAEVKAHARKVIRTIERRVESEKLLAPTQVKIVLKNKLASDAVAELSKKSGFRVGIVNETAEMKRRRVTIDTGETSFWQAFDQLCLKSKLVEAELGPNGQPIIRPMAQPMVPVPAPGPMKPEKLPQIAVEDGNTLELPTCYAGALRLRALPDSSKVVTGARTPKETVIVLEVSVEPRMAWQYGEELRIDKATDENGKDLTLVKPPAAPAPFVQPGAAPAAPRLPTLPGSQANRIPVRFSIGEIPARAAKELKGVLIGRVVTQPTALITVPDVLDAAGKTVKGEKGGSIVILEAEKDKKGGVKVRLQLEPPPDVVDPATIPGPGMPGAFPPGGLPAGLPGAAREAAGLNLLDHRGKKFQLANVSSKAAVNNGVVSREFTLVFQPQAGQGKPAKVVYEAARAASIEVQFKLGDIPLP